MRRLAFLKTVFTLPFLNNEWGDKDLATRADDLKIGYTSKTRREMSSTPRLVPQLPALANYDESLVEPYQVPPLLKFQNGAPVQTASDWNTVRRAELLEQFRYSMYGKCPEEDYAQTSCKLSYKILTKDNKAINGIATRKEILLTLLGPSGKSKSWTVLMYIPNNTQTTEKKPLPCFLGLNFAGNHAIHPDPGITMSNLVKGEKEQFECERGGRQRKWQVEKVVNAGFALATVYSGEIEPDNPDIAFEEGVHQLFSDYNDNEWGTIAAWSWGLSRTLDLLTLLPEIDESKVALIGHSRKGKAALWAGAEDTRFQLIISNNSGCAGAALSRRRFGETLALLNYRFPTWTCENNKSKFNSDENLLPIDQHALISLIAPRSVYVASAIDDLWADPKGEFTSVKYAEEIYKFLGCSGFDNELVQSMSVANVDDPVHGPDASIGYHCRSGDHDVLAYDWDQYLDFAKRRFSKDS